MQGFTDKVGIESSAIDWKNHVFHFLGQERSCSCGFSGMGDNQFCSLCGDTEEAEDTNCTSGARKERENSPSA
jgi:hypothetical protein